MEAIMKILVFRDKKTNNITCVDKCPEYDKTMLESIIQEFNDKDSNIVEVKIIKEQSLEEFLVKNYMIKKTNKNDVEECINTLYASIRRIRALMSVLEEDYKSLNEQTITK